MPNNQELLNELRADVRKANQRLSRLEKAGYESTTPHVIASDYLQGKGRARFSARKSMSEKELRQELKRVKQFLGSNESTVRGIKREVRRKYSKLVENPNPNFWNEQEYTPREISNLLKVFNLAEFKKAGELVYPSDQTAEAVREAVKQGHSVRYIEDKLKKWNEGGSKDLTELENLLGL